MARTLVIYETEAGRCPFSQWLNNLEDSRARATIRARLERIQLGNLGDCKRLGGGISEMRIFYGPGYRLYFGEDGPRIVVLLCGGAKKTQKTDIIKAKVL